MSSPGSQYVKQIDLDIARTERDHALFVHRFGVGQAQLFNVLRAYSIFNSEIGYCQGMSGLTAMLLTKLSHCVFITPPPPPPSPNAANSITALDPSQAANSQVDGEGETGVEPGELQVVDMEGVSSRGGSSSAGARSAEDALLPTPEECSFWLLDIIMHGPRFSMNDQYVPGFPMLFQTFQIHEHLLAQHLPLVTMLFQHQGLATSMYATKWYVVSLSLSLCLFHYLSLAVRE
jgi:Rab-GTPase-TBC domain